MTQLNANEGKLWDKLVNDNEGLGFPTMLVNCCN